jgi:hypothetical protein
MAARGLVDRKSLNDQATATVDGLTDNSVYLHQKADEKAAPKY